MILIVFLKKLNMINNSQKNINNYYIKKQVMMNNDEKAKIYDNLIYHYQKLQEEIRNVHACLSYIQESLHLQICL